MIKKTFRVNEVMAVNRNNQRKYHQKYVYDPVGNVTFRTNEAVGVNFSDNAVIFPVSSFIYDAVYRLIKAKGRENKANNRCQLNVPDYLQNIIDLQNQDYSQLQNYARNYDYDLSGNLLKIAHKTSGGVNWVRTITISTTNNQVKSYGSGCTPARPNVAYDGNGNIQSTSHLSRLDWNHKKRIGSKLALETQIKIQFIDPTLLGIEIHKVYNNQLQTKETIYFPGYDLVRIYENGAIQKEERLYKIGLSNSVLAMVYTIVKDNSGNSGHTEVRYQVTDVLSNTVAEYGDQDHAGLINLEEYYAYGGTAYSATNTLLTKDMKKYRFNQKELDGETNLYYYGARYYLSWLGRFASVDSMANELSNWSSYQMALANPVSNIDVDGKKIISNFGSVFHT